jgi:hypothetical protein
MSSFLYTVDYNNIKSPRASTSSRRTSTSSTKNTSNKGFTMKAALEQLKPTEAQIHPTGIYSDIIKRGSLFSGLRRSSKADSSPSQSRKHSATQSRVDAALLR